ncbi:unnamed protein product, partial [Cuscuta epithymum]
MSACHLRFHAPLLRSKYFQCHASWKSTQTHWRADFCWRMMTAYLLRREGGDKLDGWWKSRHWWRRRSWRPGNAQGRLRIRGIAYAQHRPLRTLNMFIKGIFVQLAL